MTRDRQEQLQHKVGLNIDQLNMTQLRLDTSFLLLQLKLRLFFMERIMTYHKGKPSISNPTRQSLAFLFLSTMFLKISCRNSVHFLLLCSAANLTTSTFDSFCFFWPRTHTFSIMSGCISLLAYLALNRLACRCSPRAASLAASSLSSSTMVHSSFGSTGSTPGSSLKALMA